MTTRYVTGRGLKSRRYAEVRVGYGTEERWEPAYIYGWEMIHGHRYGRCRTQGDSPKGRIMISEDDLRQEVVEGGE